MSPTPPLTNAGGTVSFNFAQGVFTAELITSDKSLTGDLTGDTLTDIVTVGGVTGPPTGTFEAQTGGAVCSGGAAPTVRLFFTSPGFAYNNFWWSNPMSYTLANGTATLTALLTDPTQWSDWNGQSGSTDTVGFYAAVAKVNAVGLSFGGCSGFENGATTSDGSGTFSSTFTETP